MSAFLDAKRGEIASRLKELEPVLAEYRELEAAAAALAGLPKQDVKAVAAPAPRTERPARRSARSGSTRRRGRPRGSGTRGLQAVNIVKSRPGITTAELAAAMGIKPNYLYRVLPGLASDKKVVQRGKGWHSLEAQATETGSA